MVLWTKKSYFYNTVKNKNPPIGRLSHISTIFDGLKNLIFKLFFDGQPPSLLSAIIDLTFIRRVMEALSFSSSLEEM